MSVWIYIGGVIVALGLVAGAVRGFNWLMGVMGLDDDSWPQGPR